MARIRTIKPEFFYHEELAKISPHARLLAIGMLCLADCEGRIRWVPMQVHSQVFPWEDNVKIEVLLGEVSGCGYCFPYEVLGKRYVQICNFRKHQRLSGKELSYKSLIPPPPTESNVLPPENGEVPVKHLGTSRGSSGNPLGTGEHRNIGTEECAHTPERPKRQPRQPNKVEAAKPDDVVDDVWDTLIANRKVKRQGPVTKIALKSMREEAAKLGLTLQQALTISAKRSWASFRASWDMGDDIKEFTENKSSKRKFMSKYWWKLAGGFSTAITEDRMSDLIKQFPKDPEDYPEEFPQFFKKEQNG